MTGDFVTLEDEKENDEKDNIEKQDVGVDKEEVNGETEDVGVDKEEARAENEDVGAEKEKVKNEKEEVPSAPGSNKEAKHGKAADIESMTVDDIAIRLKELTFEIKDRTIDLPMGDKVKIVKVFAPLLQDYCDIVPKVASKVESYFSKNQVPIAMIKAMDVYYYELKRVMRKNPEVQEDENLKNAIHLVVTPYEKVIQTMVDVARRYAKARGGDYDTDY